MMPLVFFVNDPAALTNTSEVSSRALEHSVAATDDRTDLFGHRCAPDARLASLAALRPGLPSVSVRESPLSSGLAPI